MTLQLTIYFGLCVLVLLANLGERRRAAQARAAATGSQPIVLNRPWSTFSLKRLSLRLPGLAEDISFSARSIVHRLALALMVGCSVMVVAGLWLGADPTPNNPQFTNEATVRQLLVVNATLYLSLALLGVGWGSRRRRRAVAARLGLRRPCKSDWLAGAGVAALLFLMAQAGTALWQQTVPPEDFATQTRAARLIFDAFNDSLQLGIALAIVTAVSEEALFRGALQPVFGSVVTSLFFVLLHTQYLFTPGALILLVVSFGFAWLRIRWSASAAIIAHAVYNTLPFMLFHLAV